MAYVIVLTVLSLGLVQCYNYNQNTNYYYPSYSGYSSNHKYCDDLSPYYGDIDLEQITGVWYGVEKIPHNKGEYKIDHTNECFYIDIKEVDKVPTPPTPYHMTTSPYANSPQYTTPRYGLLEPYRIRHFVLQWHEGLWQADYHIKLNTSRKGFWPTDVPYNSVEHMYRFFGGVIQVLKVANNHLVLNFCMRLPYQQQYSVVFARNENQLTPEDLTIIHNVFTLKNLSTSSLKRVCDSSATRTTVSTLILLVFSIVFYRSH